MRRAAHRGQNSGSARIAVMRNLQQPCTGLPLESCFAFSGFIQATSQPITAPSGDFCMTATTPAASPHVMNTYGRVPIALARGQGCRVWDVNGKEYLDGLGGIAVNTLGHNHAKLIHPSNYYHVPLQEQLAAKLVELSGMQNVFFCNSGLEANEAALKIARKFGVDKGIAKPEIVVYEKAFHGRSIATMSATGNPKIHSGFGPLVEGFIRVPMNDIEAIKKATEGNPNVVAVFFETIQGEGGINSMRVEYLQQMRKLCDERGWLMMIDEVQCGVGRTGKWFAHQWAGIVPDVMPLAKGLGSGVPIGAVVAGPWPCAQGSRPSASWKRKACCKMRPRWATTCGQRCSANWAACPA